MQKIQLYLNDEPVELSDDTPIALTFQINNLAEVKNQQGNTSNQFKIPLTARNRAILGFPADTPVTNEKPYRKYAAKVIQDGIEIIPNGFAEIRQTDEQFADLAVLSGNVDFFDLLIGKIYDMSAQFAKYEHVWNLQNAFNSQNKTDGWIWPIVDYGYFTGEVNEVIDVRYQRPAFFLHTAIEEICALTGFEVKGKMLDLPMYKKLLVAFANDEFQHGDTYTAENGGFSSKVKKTSNQAMPKNTLQAPVTFTQILNDPSLSYNPATSEYTAKEIVSVKATVKYSLENTDTYVGGSTPATHIKVQKFSNGQWTDVGENSHANTLPAGTVQYFYDKTLSVETDLVVGDKLRVLWRHSPSTDRIKGVIYSGATFAVENVSQNVLFKQKVQCERIFPDITQKELLKDTFQRFGIICSTDNNRRVINFAQFKEIVENIPVAKDWSDKMIDQGKTVYFQLGDYARVNYMNYAEDETVKTGYGNSKIIIDDETLAAENVLIESKFAATQPSLWNGIACAKIGMIEIVNSEKQFNISVSPRILIDEKINLGSLGKTATFTDGQSSLSTTGTVSIPYFNKDDGSENLSWDYLRETHYEELEHVLHRCKKIVRYFNLNAIDIYELDLLIPVYLRQEGAYFYINKIDSYIKGKPTKVELVRL